MTAWTRHKGVTVVECPDCGFCFDADHEDTTGGYSCPACAELALTQRATATHWKCRICRTHNPIVWRKCRCCKLERHA